MLNIKNFTLYTLRWIWPASPPLRPFVKYCIAAILVAPMASTGADLPLPQVQDEQRQQFQKAIKAWDQGRADEFDRLAEKLKTYPLYPYLQYRKIKRRSTAYQDVHDFILAYPDFPDNVHLLERWLPYLAKQDRWEEFLEIYDPGVKSERLRCLALEAHAGVRRPEAVLVEKTLPLFLSGKSRHPACDTAFKRLYDSAGTDKFVLERIGLALEAGRMGLARHLIKQLDDRQSRAKAEHLVQTHQKPLRVLRSLDREDAPAAGDVHAYAVRRLAALGLLDQAIAQWRKIRGHYTYLTEERERTARYLARRALRRKHPEVLELLEEAGPLDQQLFEWRLQAALRSHDWRRLAAWTRAIPADDPDVNRPQWLYWQARAVEAQGRSPAAQALYRELAEKRDYYGFLAADRMGLPYNMIDAPVDATPELLHAVASEPAMQRSREWFLLGQQRQARREWRQAIRDMDREQLEASAQLTTSWGWHDRAIFALGRAKSYDDLSLRFPLLHEVELRQEAERHNLDLGWVFATVRAESAFMENARSPAGALGLMQLMPAVGRSKARALKLRNYSTAKLLEAGTNIRLGSAYLVDLYQDFNGNVALATGAYNAGPHRVRTWLKRRDCGEPDVWIELIPFQETRRHVKRVLFYAAVYTWRLERSHARISEHMRSSNGSMPLCTQQREAYREPGSEQDS